tara:strand:- start:881 stop:1057 length:177 start_codon:yes stop_codon:yes gene_type:complete
MAKSQLVVIDSTDTIELHKDGDTVSVIRNTDTVNIYKKDGWSEQKSAPKSKVKKSLDD